VVTVCFRELQATNKEGLSNAVPVGGQHCVRGSEYTDSLILNLGTKRKRVTTSLAGRFTGVERTLPTGAQRIRGWVGLGSAASSEAL